MNTDNNKTASVSLDFYGVKLQIDSDHPPVIEDLKRDFAYFISQTQNSNIKIIIYKKSPPYEMIPPLKESMHTANAVNYDDKNIRYSDYYGKALTIYDYKNETCKVYSENENLLYEISYLLILSRSGELLDRKGMHRVHALGISYKGNGVLILLPMKGGKTTLALDLLKHPDIKILSEDTPIIKGNTIYPFPLRLGIQKGDPVDAPKEMQRDFRFNKGSTKILIDIDYYKEKIASPCPIKLIIAGKWEFSNNNRIESISIFGAFGKLLSNLVFGLGLPQIVEYFLTANIRSTVKKLPIFISRLILSLNLCLKNKKVCFVLGRHNRTAALLDYLKRDLS